MTTRRTALKGMAGAFALGAGGFHWDFASAGAGRRNAAAL